MVNLTQVILALVTVLCVAEMFALRSNVSFTSLSYVEIYSLTYEVTLFLFYSTLIISSIVVIRNIREEDYLELRSIKFSRFTQIYAMALLWFSLIKTILALNSLANNLPVTNYNQSSPIIWLFAFFLLLEIVLSLVAVFIAIYLHEVHFNKKNYLYWMDFFQAIKSRLFRLQQTTTNLPNEYQIFKEKVKTIRCEFCLARIKPSAQKCRHCGEWVADNKD